MHLAINCKMFASNRIMFAYHCMHSLYHSINTLDNTINLPYHSINKLHHTVRERKHLGRKPSSGMQLLHLPQREQDNPSHGVGFWGRVRSQAGNRVDARD